MNDMQENFKKHFKRESLTFHSPIPPPGSCEPGCPGPEPHSWRKNYKTIRYSIQYDTKKWIIKTLLHILLKTLCLECILVLYSWVFFWHCARSFVTHLDLMLLKFLPSERCLMERFLASQTSRVVRSMSRPEPSSTDTWAGHNSKLILHNHKCSKSKMFSPLSEMSRLVILGISATQPSKIWEPPERSWEQKTVTMNTAP